MNKGLSGVRESDEKCVWTVQDILRCVLHPGDIVFVPNSVRHATCNLDETTLALGWQGDTSHWPLELQVLSEGRLGPRLEGRCFQRYFLL